MTYLEMMNRLMSLRTYVLLKSISDNMYDGWSQDVTALTKAIDILHRLSDEEKEK